jgi:hypothetical protein
MATNLRSNFADFFGTSKLPELQAVIEATTESYPSMIPILFNEEGMTTDIAQHTTMSGLRNPIQVGENVPVQFQTIKSGYPKTYTATKWGTGYRISKEAVDDGKFGFIERATKSFSKGMFEVKEIAAADIFDNGFTTNGYDGVPLFSNSHPLENGGGVVGDNLGTAAELSITSYRDLRNLFQNTLNEDGQFVKYMPKFLVLPQALQDIGQEIVKSQYNPEDANNAINTVYDTIALLPGNYWQYLDSDTAFFLVGDKAEHWLMFMSREAMSTDSDYDKEARAWELMCFSRWDVGYSNWRAICGNAGA